MSQTGKIISISAVTMAILTIALILRMIPTREPSPAEYGYEISTLPTIAETTLAADPDERLQPLLKDEALPTEAEEDFPLWTEWEEDVSDFEDAYVVLKDKKVSLYADTSCTDLRWNSDEDWSVQDMVIKDVDRDGTEELILLVWKHGSYGNSKPFWVKENDNRLGQHIFIFSYDKDEEIRMHSIWMSSEIKFNIISIASGTADQLILNIQGAGPQLWAWRSFGIKYVSDAKPAEIDLVCVGDNLIHLPLLYEDSSGNGLYEKIAPTIREADIAAINLETILVDNERSVSDYPRFGTPIEVGEALVNAGFDVFNMANNHVLDKGAYGVDTTVAFFKEHDLPYFGANGTAGYTGNYKDSVAFVEKDGITVAFLGYTYGMNGLHCPEEYPYMTETFDDTDRMIRQIKYARANADVVVVYAHWGREYKTQPSRSQVTWAQFFAEQKVDIVIGSHPHVLQKTDVVTDPESGHETIVYYSLGNFVSGQQKPGTQEGGIAKITIARETDGAVRIREHSLQKTRMILSEEGCWAELDTEN
jgi:poly-gamma-glutamate capsule biosynthesis protein CapA/YwtB (metallophosphatase superfamily)